jgi:hypothetical protein
LYGFVIWPENQKEILNIWYWSLDREAAALIFTLTAGCILLYMRVSCILCADLVLFLFIILFFLSFKGKSFYTWWGCTYIMLNTLWTGSESLGYLFSVWPIKPEGSWSYLPSAHETLVKASTWASTVCILLAMAGFIVAIVQIVLITSSHFQNNISVPSAYKPTNQTWILENQDCYLSPNCQKGP